MVPEPLFALNPPTFSSPIRDRFPEQDKTLRSDSNPQIKLHTNSFFLLVRDV